MSAVGTRQQDEGRGVPGQQAVAVGSAQVYQAGRDLHVHPAQARPALRRGDLTPRVLPGSVHPVMRAPLRGRTEALAFLRKNLAERKHVVVTGPPGAGKSLLLRHAADREVLAGTALGGDVGMIWVDTPPSVVDVLGAVLRECYEFDRSRTVPDDLVRDALRDVRALVVLDDVDLTPDEVGHILSVLRGCVVVLASRRD
ncbi:hypothetical protein AB0G02_23125, partial [Actinosynnema sp. NPDC023658]